VTLIAFIVVLAIAAVVAGWALEQNAKRGAASQREAAWLPGELRQAQLLFSEPRPFFIDGEIPLVARPDRAYRLIDGTVRLIELKTRTRHAVYEQDVIELSVQRTVLMGNGIRPVSRQAYVITQVPGTCERKVHVAELLDETTTMRLARRYVAVRDGTAEPIRTEHRRKCKSCAHARACRPDGPAV
jgi:hypothetical protein